MTDQAVFYAEFDPDTGRIERVISVPPPGIDARPGLLFLGQLSKATDGKNYVVNPQNNPALAARATLGATWNKTAIAADGNDFATLSGLPVPCVVHVDGVPVPVSDGLLEFGAVAPGQYRIKVDEAAYLPAEWVVDAT